MARMSSFLSLALVMTFAIGFCHAGSCKLLFKDCGSTAGQLNSAMFNGTCNAGKAILKQGTTVAITFNFKTKNTEATLKSTVHGKISALPFVPFPLGNPDACKNSGLTCPVPANTNVNYKAAFPILKSYPKVNVIVKWELQNKDGEDVFCVLLPATITS